jgi:GNAT superfamily N-acetyltransferase
MNLDLRSRAPRTDDLPAILALFEAAFDKKMSAAHYRWKLESRPSPVENVVIAVDQSDRPVFHSAGIPCKCRIGGKERWVMLGADVMTAPAYRRRGLNSRYSSELYARWRDAGVALVLGFTNDHWGSSAQNVGLRPLGPLASMVLPLRPEKILARKSGVAAFGEMPLIGALWRRLQIGSTEPTDPRYRIQELRSAGPEFDVLWTRSAPALDRSLVRDQAWVTWRYFDSPDVRYRVLIARLDSEPVGYVAFSQPEPRVANIVEVFTHPDDAEAFAALLRFALAMVSATGAEVVRTLAAPGTQAFQAFRRAGFLPRGKGMIQHIPLDSTLTPAEIGEAKDWHFAAGDFDAV